MTNDALAPPGAPAQPQIREIGFDDVTAALREGWEDFRAAPAYGFTTGAWAVLGGWILLWLLASTGRAVYAWPLATGFAIMGPLLALALYEVSRRRDTGEPISWAELRRAAFANKQIMFMGLILGFALMIWLRMAWVIYALFFGMKPLGIGALMTEAFTSMRGFSFLMIGNAVGAFFAFFIFSISAVSFPYLMDRDADAVSAMLLSVGAVVKNPRVMFGWGVLVAVILAMASIPAFLGLIIAFPLLGHASWRLYKKLVAL